MMRLSAWLLFIAAVAANSVPSGSSATVDANDITQEHCLAQKSVTRVAAHEQLKQARKLLAAEEGDKRPTAAKESAKQPGAAEARKLLAAEEGDTRPTVAKESAKLTGAVEARKLLAAEEGDKRPTVAKESAKLTGAVEARKLLAAEEGDKRPTVAEESAKQPDAVEVTAMSEVDAATPPAGHQGALLQHQGATELGKKNGPAFMNMTKMDQGTLPEDSRHINHKTVSADWHKEYPVASAETQEKAMEAKGAATGARLAATTMLAAVFTVSLLHV